MFRLNFLNVTITFTEIMTKLNFIFIHSLSVYRKFKINRLYYNLIYVYKVVVQWYMYFAFYSF